MAAMFAGLRACFGRGAGESEPAPARTAMLGHAGAGPRLDAISIAAASCGSAVHARGVGAPPVLTLNAPAGPHDESAPPAEPGSNAAGAKSVMLAATSGQCGPSGAMALPAAAQAPEYGTSSSGGATATGTPPSSTAQLSAHIIPGKQAPSTLTPAASSSSWPALSPVTSARDESDGPLRLLLRRLAGSFNHPWPSASRALSGRPQQEELRSAATAPTPMSVPERAHAPSTRSLPPDAAAAALPPAVAGPPVPPAGRVMHRRGDTSVSDGMVWAATAGGPNGSGSGAGEGSASGGVGGVPAGGSMGLGSGQRTFSSWSLASSGGAGGAEGGERSLVSAALCRVTSGGSSSASPPLGGRASSGGSGGHGRDASASAALAEAEAAARQFATQFVQVRGFGVGAQRRGVWRRGRHHAMPSAVRGCGSAQALLSGNVVWASHPLVADLLDGACEMVTHDGQLHQGRTAIIRRLNKGEGAAAALSGGMGPADACTAAESRVRCAPFACFLHRHGAVPADAGRHGG